MRDAVTLARRLVRLDTRGGGEKPAADMVASVLADAGFQVRVDEPVTDRANVVARLGDDTPVTLTGHLDTVPAEAADWTFDPLSAAIDGDRLLGRGSSDMKAGVACLLSGACQLADEGGGGVQLVLTFGEETGCAGAEKIDRSWLNPTRLLLVAEPTGNRVVLGHKGTLWLRLAARGTSAHGSRPDLGRNAIAPLARTALRLHDRPEWPSSPTHGAATVNVGTLRAGSQPNLVPDHAEMYVDIRTVPGFDSDAAVAAVRELADPEVTVERVLDLPGVDTDAELDTVRASLPVLGTNPATWQPEYATYFTDASVLAAKLDHPPVLVYGPGEPEQAHVVDESCSVSAIHASADGVHRLLRECRTWS